MNRRNLLSPERGEATIPAHGRAVPRRLSGEVSGVWTQVPARPPPGAAAAAPPSPPAPAARRSIPGSSRG
jgi:hypothetical protein